MSQKLLEKEKEVWIFYKFSMKRILLLFLLLTLSNSFAQAVKGRVFDENKQPLPGANIYFDGTTIATISDENGNFTLSYGSKLNSILAISFIGYQTQFLNNFNSDKELIIYLKIATNSLNEVVIKKDRFSRKQKLQLFREQFLGRTATAKKAKILNEDDIYFDYDEVTKTLKAYSDKPLLIKNDLLGYKITYELVDFEANFYQLSIESTHVERCFYAGLTRFEEVNSDKKIIKLREECYKGSQLHFFRTIASKSWEKENFRLYVGRLPVNPLQHFLITNDKGNTKVQVKKQTQQLTKSVAIFSVLYNEKLQSKMILETESFYIDKYGINSNIEDIVFSGYMSDQKVGEMLPVNYGIE